MLNYIIVNQLHNQLENQIVEAWTALINEILQKEGVMVMVCGIVHAGPPDPSNTTGLYTETSKLRHKGSNTS